MGFNAPFFDWDYFQDNLGDIYQSLEAFIPLKGIFALQKYHLVEAPLPDHFYWVQKFTQKIFERMIPNYSAEFCTPILPKVRINNSHRFSKRI